MSAPDLHERREIARRRLALLALAVAVTLLGLTAVLTAVCVLFGGWWALLIAGVVACALGMWVIPA